jgi:hypothetical protein
LGLGRDTKQVKVIRERDDSRQLRRKEFCSITHGRILFSEAITLWGPERS